LSHKSSHKRRGKRAQDPHLERERARYAQPLPSREFVLQVLTEQGVPLSEDALAELLEVRPEERSTFARRLNAMEREGEIMRNRKGAVCLPEKMELVRGRVEGHPDGYGFLAPDDGSADLFLSSKQMLNVLHGDRVIGREIGVDRRGRREGVIVEVLERVNQRLVGRVFVRHGVLFVVAENKRISRDIVVAPGEARNAKAGQVVEVELISQPDRHAEPVARVLSVLGNYADPGMEIEIALRKHALPFEWSSKVEAEAKKLPKKVLKKDTAGREDLRELALVTIDGETAKDFDDAVYCEKQGKGFRLIVAIADVSHYVRPGTALDEEAMARGNSVYFPRRVIPMLPEALSNELCSLKPQVDRLCMACEMNISARGEVKEYRFFEAVMHSQARLTYTQVAGWLYGDAPTLAEDAALLPHLRNLDDLYQALSKARTRRGAIEFETSEPELRFDDQGKIVSIRPSVRNEAHRLIEECMLAANVCASEFLSAHEQATLYRVHDSPTPEKLRAVREVLREFGLQLTGGDEPHAKDYAAVMQQIKGKPHGGFLQTLLLRSMQQAIYSPENVGHFGLAYEAYAHFTSPIRRYPDLLVHRAIRAVLAGGNYRPGDWRAIGEHCSQTERRADEASRDVMAWLKCYYMQDRVGEQFSGTVSGVTAFGVFVTLDEIFVDGLIHVSELGNDYFHFDATKHQLVGERTRQSYRLGDRVQVNVVRVDLETSKIDFTPVDAHALGGWRKQLRRTKN
jgi:ribonuclease R